MRFWFVHSSDVSLREQVVAQVTLGILTGELQPGERLPSVRELARRFGLHANTVSAGYQQLVAEGWVDSRRGSGVFVRESRPASAPAGGHAAGHVAASSSATTAREQAFERILANFFHATHRLGFAEADVLARVQQWTAREAPRRVLLVEPDPQLRRIVHAELTALLPPTVALEACGSLDEAGADDAGVHEAGVDGAGIAAESLLAGTLVTVLPSKLESVRAQVRISAAAGRTPPPVLALRVRSVPNSLAAALPRDVQAHAGNLIGIASGWDEFLRFARTMLVATGFAPDALLLRHTAEPGWRAGLDQASITVCDALSAAALPTARTIVFRLLHDRAGEELRDALRAPASSAPSRTPTA